MYYDSTSLLQFYVYDIENKIAILTTIEKYFYQITIIIFLNVSLAMLITQVSHEIEKLPCYGAAKVNMETRTILPSAELSELM